MSNYPPDVRLEYAITGATIETDRPESCPRCSTVGAVTQSTYRDSSWVYCYHCGWSEYIDAQGKFKELEQEA